MVFKENTKHVILILWSSRQICFFTDFSPTQKSQSHVLHVNNFAIGYLTYKQIDKKTPKKSERGTQKSLAEFSATFNVNT